MNKKVIVLSRYMNNDSSLHLIFIKENVLWDDFFQIWRFVCESLNTRG